MKRAKINYSRLLYHAAVCGLIAISWLVFVRPALAQDSISFEYISEFEFPSAGFFIPSCFANQVDHLGRAYVYTANKHAGVITFNIDQQTNPIPIDTLSVQDFKGIRPTYVEQQEELLYVALGEFEGLGTQPAGLAIVNIENPEQPIILNQWDSLAFDTGCPIAAVSDGFAYLGAMESGVIILDVSNPNQIKFVSQLTLDRTFPQEPTPTSEPHARGLALYGDNLLVAHDAGGLRVVNVSNKFMPVEEIKYVNDSMYNKTKVAYNKVAVHNDRAYITTDYCGMEVLDLTSLPSLSQGEWHNPFDCMPQTWFGGEGHTNGIKILKEEALVFMSAGDTEVLVYDIKDETQIQEIGRYQMPDSTVAWSLDVQDDLIVLSCIDNHLFPLQPYYGDFGGIILLRWKREFVATENKNNADNHVLIFPNPVQDKLTVYFEEAQLKPMNISIYNMLGQQMYFQTIEQVKHNITLNTSHFMQGQYMLVIDQGDIKSAGMFIKN